MPKDNGLKISFANVESAKKTIKNMKLVAHKNSIMHTPDEVNKALTKYKNGDWADILLMMQNAATDGKIKSVISQLRSGVSNLVWEVSPAKSIETDEGLDSSTEDKKHAKISDYVFRQAQLNNLIEQLVNGALYGANIINWKWSVKNNWNVPIAFDEINRDLIFVKDKKAYIKIDTNTIQEITGDDVLSVVFLNEEGPMLLPATILYYMKTYILGLWAKTVAMHGAPYRMGTFDAEMDPENDPDDKINWDKMVEALANFGEDCWGLFPDNFKFDLKESMRQTGDHKYFVEYIDEQISVSILNQNLTSMVKSGARATAETHETMLMSRIKNIGNFVEGHIQQVLEIAEKFNFAPKFYSHFNFKHLYDSEKMKDTIELVKTAKDNGLRVTAKFYKENNIDVEEATLAK